MDQGNAETSGRRARIQEVEQELAALAERRRALEQELAQMRGGAQPGGQGLEEALSMFEQIIESTDDGIMIEDQKGLVSFANMGFVRMAGYESRDQVLDRPWPDFFSLDEEKKIPGRPGMYESLLVTRDRSRIPILITSTSFYFRGEYRGVLSLIKDIAGRKRMEEALARSEKYAAIAQLSLGISHEIKNPLSVMQAHLDLVKSNKTIKNIADEKLNYSFEVMNTQARRIAATVRSLSNLAHDRPPEMRPMDLTRLLDDVSDMFFPKFKKGGVVLERRYARRDPVALEADEGKLIQLFTNLYFNALEAMPEGGGLRVDVRPRPESGEVELAFEDSGSGISAEIRKRIADPFFTTKPAGTGMGLAICQRIVEEHHGTLEFDEAPGGGALVIVRLPLIQP